MLSAPCDQDTTLYGSKPLLWQRSVYQTIVGKKKQEKKTYDHFRPTHTYIKLTLVSFLNFYLHLSLRANLETCMFETFGLLEPDQPIDCATFPAMQLFDCWDEVGYMGWRVHMQPMPMPCCHSTLTKQPVRLQMQEGEGIIWYGRGFANPPVLPKEMMESIFFSDLNLDWRLFTYYIRGG